MSNSIWKMPDLKPDIFQAHRVLVIYEAHDEPELMLSTQYEAYTADRHINRWCYWDEFIAQADKAERLQKAVDVAEEALKYARQRGLDNTATLFAVGTKADKALTEIKKLTQGHNQ